MKRLGVRIGVQHVITTGQDLHLMLDPVPREIGRELARVCCTGTRWSFSWCTSAGRMPCCLKTFREEGARLMAVADKP